MSTIKVELLSDLCTATGTGYSSFVDTDISYDSWGLPYIPARRLKGCLREAGEYIGIDSDTLNRLFGEPGKDRPGTLMISNGLLPEAEDLRAYLDQRKANKEPISPQTVLNLFTHVRATTAIDHDTGIAKKETLRYTRVINQKHPSKKNDANLAFIFECEDDGEKITHDVMDCICKALRSIGANRTRGLGAVKCIYSPSSLSGNVDIRNASTEKQLKLHLKLLDPLLITAVSADECVNYVSGAAVLGAMASLYLKQFKNADGRFEQLFLSGKVTYGNLYISDAAGTECIPAPYYIRKLKSSEPEVDGKTLTFYDDKADLIRSWMKDADKEAFEKANKLVQPKPMRGKMLSRTAFSKKLISEYKVLTERVYHHSIHNFDRSAIWQRKEIEAKTEQSEPNDASMYTHTCIEAGQYLFGTIVGPENLLSILSQLLQKWPLHLGMSRSAQYSRCQPVDNRVEIANLPQEALISIPVGGKAVIALESDLIPDTQDDMIKFIVNSVIPQGTDYEIQRDQTALDYHMIHGYHAKRNLRNTPLYAVVMGSVITVKLLSQLPTPLKNTVQIGRRQAEGFGVIHLYDAEQLKGFQVSCQAKNTTPIQPICPDNIIWFEESLKAANKSHAIKLGREIYNEKKACFNDRNISASMIMRLMLMAEESDTPEAMSVMINKMKKKEKKDISNQVFESARKRFNQLETESLWKDCWLTVLRLARYDLKGKVTEV